MKRDTDLIAELYRSVSPDNKRLVRALETRLNQAKADTAKYRPLADMPGATQHIPLRYQSAIVALAIIAHHGVRRPDDAGGAPGAFASRVPSHESTAYRLLRTEQRELARRAERVETALNALVDHECSRCGGPVKAGLTCGACLTHKQTVDAA